MRSIFFTCALAVAAGPLAAQPYLAKNRLVVNPLSGQTFEVIESRGAGATDIWCAAADYTRRAGLDGARKRLFVLSPLGPSKTQAGAKAVAYTLAPDERLLNTAPSYSVSVRREGENLSVGHAYKFCDVFIDDLLDRF
ncbi:hypothetical protein [uncultured Roseobacter sp.]|uniref:hypothetical protein n=1 Tax=uncultured Roseobacter sp. TaxID=114847 RepID=UPI002602808F|nr:hypothetical protein [uncultured Roseobacter sp.]